MTIPYRAFYPIRESAELLGVSTKHLYELMAKGRRPIPPPEAIPARHVRKLAGKVTLSRAYVFGEETAPVTAIGTGPSHADIERAVEDVLIKLGAKLQAERSIRRVS